MQPATCNLQPATCNMQPATRIALLPLLLAFSLSASPQARKPVSPVVQSQKVVCSFINPVKISEIANQHFLIDFGTDAFGTVVLDLKPAQADTLVIHLGEKVDSTGRIDRNPGGTIRYQKVLLPVQPSISNYTVQLARDTRNTNPPAIALPDSFGVVMPFRYCEIENLTVPVSEVGIRQKTYHYPFNNFASDFTCSDTVLNQVWELCKTTIKATSFCGYYIDGDRERIPYEADALINQLSHYAVDSEYGLARRTNEYFIDHPTWPTEWILQTAFLFYHDFMYTGDISSVEKYYTDLKQKSLLSLEREDGLISTSSGKLTDEIMGLIGFSDRKYRIRDIVDWPGGYRDGHEFMEINTVVNSFYYRNLILMSELAGYLGLKQDQAFYQDKARNVKESFNRILLDTEKGIYRDGENSGHSSFHSNLFPLALGLVPEEYEPSVLAFVKSRGMACSVYGAQFLLEGLYQSGEADYALSLMASTGEQSWWNMIRSGSTLTLEAWDMKAKNNLDWNHAWGTAPANIITRYLWGITPAEPGFTKARIRPQPGSLTSSRIRVPTIRGPITAEYQRITDNRQLYTIEIPPGMKADFEIWPDQRQRIFVNGRRARVSGGVVALDTGMNRVEVVK